MRPVLQQPKPQPRRLPSRDAIVDAGIAALADNPEASLSAIAGAAGVSRATLHRYFADRQALIDTISLQAIQETDAAVNAIDWEGMTSREYLLAVFEAVIPLGDRYHMLSRAPLDAASDAVREAYSRQLRGVDTMVQWMAREGLVASKVPAAWAVLVIDSLIYAAWTAVREGSVAPRDAAALACRTCLRGLSENTR